MWKSRITRSFFVQGNYPRIAPALKLFIGNQGCINGARYLPIKSNPNIFKLIFRYIFHNWCLFQLLRKILCLQTSKSDDLSGCMIILFAKIKINWRKKMKKNDILHNFNFFCSLYWYFSYLCHVHWNSRSLVIFYTMECMDREHHL